ncbi:hypothetical protein KIN20_020097 [Parelaphostrongylus tenuis]|uniref:protein-histidine N-methyltransferase n=1 Tax=Parelaphostrongylus tenuis TaxID=148309 RepID=A0AAD5N5L0_PARTN|nr:hypothetical protein KIN20_020097 [Parelaphostrongylus tenuis]
MSLKLPDVELVWASDDTIKRRLTEEGFNKDDILRDTTQSDRITHVYEGGFKVWECCYDLCKLIHSESSLIRGRRVLELGCGAGLPAILCALRGAAHITLHDYNEYVIRCFTQENLRLNGIDESRYCLRSGPWSDIRSATRPHYYDIIITSETIYNTDDYDSLHDAFNYALSPTGIIWVAAKIFYFGVGGNVPTFMEFVANRGIFKVSTKQSISSDIPRVILELKR